MSIIKYTKSPYSKIKSIRLNSPLMTRAIIGTIALLIISLLLHVKVSMILFFIFAVFFNTWLAGFQISRNLPTDLELSTFSTVMVTLAFDFRWGLVIAIFSKLIASIYTGNVVADHFFMIATYINAALISAMLHGVNPTVLGMSIVVINCFLMFTISKNLLGIDVTANLAYTGTNLIFNSLVFLILTQPVLALLRA